MRRKGFTPVLQSHRRRSSNDLERAAVLTIQRWWRKTHFHRVADKMKAVRLTLQARRQKIQQMDEEIAEISKAVSSSKNDSPQPKAKKGQASRKNTPMTEIRLKKIDSAVKYQGKSRSTSKENLSQHLKRSESTSTVYSGLDTGAVGDRATSILQYLEESDASSLPNISQIETPSVPLAEVAKYKTEIEEAAKTILTLKAIIERQKSRVQERVDELREEHETQLAAQKAEFGGINEKNMEFLQSLLKDKEEFMKQQNEVSRRLKEAERRHLKDIEELKAHHEKELKRQKEIMNTSEKIKRENWLKEKTREIKEATARGLEPEVARLMSEQRQVLERVKEQHRVELKALREELANEKDEAQKEARNAWLSEADRRVEQERRVYADKISELLARQESEMAEMRRRINDEISTERLKSEHIREASDENWKKRLAELEGTWTRKLADAVAEHKACCDEQKRKHSCEILRLRDEHSGEMTAWLEVQHNKLQKDIKDKTAAIRAELVAERDAELKKVIEKLSSEQIDLKRRFEAETAAQLKSANEKHLLEVKDFLGKLESMKANCASVQGQAKEWETKAKDLEMEVSDLNYYLGEKDQTISELRVHIDKLEAQIDGQDELVRKALEQADNKYLTAQAILVEEMRSLQSELAKTQSSHLQELELLSKREAEGYAAIEQRVRQTVKKKDEKIRELTENLKVAQVKSRKLEELLDSQRRELTLL